MSCAWKIATAAKARRKRSVPRVAQRNPLLHAARLILGAVRPAIGFTPTVVEQVGE
jgi:hypothetical protein